MAQPEILTNIRTGDNVWRNAFELRMTRAIGYCPMFGATKVDTHQAGIIYDFINLVNPGYKWLITVRDEVIRVWNLTLHAEFGFSLTDGMLDSDGKVVRSYASGLLDKFGLEEGPMEKDRIDSMPRDGQGNCFFVAGAYNGGFELL